MLFGIETGFRNARSPFHIGIVKMNHSTNRTSSRIRILIFFSLLATLTLAGCESPNEPAKAEPIQQPVIGQVTDEIGEYDPNGDAVIADLQVPANANPLSAAGGAYTFAAGQTSTLKVQHALNLFQAEHGRFPKDHAEFMERIIKANNITLPVMPGKRQYQYDVDNHKIVIVEPGSSSDK